MHDVNKLITRSAIVHDIWYCSPIDVEKLKSPTKILLQLKLLHIELINE